MAEFKVGDRIVKREGAFSGLCGTVKNISDDGTLNVAFDTIRLPKYCDPQKCVPVAVNASWQKGRALAMRYNAGIYQPIEKAFERGDFKEAESVRRDLANEKRILEDAKRRLADYDGYLRSLKKWDGPAKTKQELKEDLEVQSDVVAYLEHLLSQVK